jgi:hypothetical protein
LADSFWELKKYQWGSVGFLGWVFESHLTAKDN